MAKGNLVEFNEGNWASEVAGSDKPVLVDFFGTWCPPCKALLPTIVKVADQFAGKVKVGKVNIDDNQELAVKYGITSVPQVLIFQGGDQPKYRRAGIVPEAELVKMLTEVSAG